MIHTGDLLRKLSETPPGADARAMLMDLVLESLAPQHRKVLGYIADNPSVSTMQIAKWMKRPQNQIGNITKALSDMALVEGMPTVGHGALYYRWVVRKRAE